MAKSFRRTRRRHAGGDGILSDGRRCRLHAAGRGAGYSRLRPFLQAAHHCRSAEERHLPLCHGKDQVDDGAAAALNAASVGKPGARSFRGATEGGEPGIHTPAPVVMDSGLAAFAAPRNDAPYDSKFKIAESGTAHGCSCLDRINPSSTQRNSVVAPISVTCGPRLCIPCSWREAASLRFRSGLSTPRTGAKSAPDWIAVPARLRKPRASSRWPVAMLSCLGLTEPWPAFCSGRRTTASLGIRSSPASLPECCPAAPIDMPMRPMMRALPRWGLDLAPTGLPVTENPAPSCAWNSLSPPTLSICRALSRRSIWR